MYISLGQDRKLRRELSRKHSASAREKLTLRREAAAMGGGEGPGSRAGGSAPGRVEAMREAMKALALDEENADAQKLLVDLLTDMSGEVPEEAQGELRDVSDRARKRGARTAVIGFSSWLLMFPVVIVVGVTSWPVVLAEAGVTSAAILWALHLYRLPRYDRWHLVVMAALVAFVVALSSCYLGPFTLMPTCGATATMFCAMHATRRERVWLGMVIGAGALLPFVLEIVGVLPRAYTFEPEGVLVHVRAIALPRSATMALMIYSTMAFVGLAASLVGRLGDALRASEQRHFLQAWYLRRLFPTDGTKG